MSGSCGLDAVIQSRRTFGFPPTWKSSEYTLPFSLFRENLLSKTVPVLQLRQSSSVSCHESRGSILTGLTVAWSNKDTLTSHIPSTDSLLLHHLLKETFVICLGEPFWSLSTAHPSPTPVRMTKCAFCSCRKNPPVLLNRSLNKQTGYEAGNQLPWGALPLQISCRSAGFNWMGLWTFRNHMLPTAS